MKGRGILKWAVFVQIMFLGFVESKAQEFPISDVYSTHFSVDRKTQMVYLEDAVYGTIYEYNVRTKQTSVSKFTFLPFFANKEHLAVYGNGNEANFYDFEKDSTFQINGVDVNTVAMYIPNIFSPNDSGFVGIESYDDEGSQYYYSFSRNRIFYPFPQGLRWESPPPSWSSDTTMMFLSVNHDAIVNINLLTGKIDTVFTSLTPTGSILYFNYKPNFDFITYSYANEDDSSPKIRRYYFNEKRDSVVYDFDIENPTSHCKGGPFGFTEIKWSPDSKKFSFLGYFYTISASSVYCYFVDSTKTYLYGECDEYGLKNGMQWLNNDTVVYVNNTLHQIYAYDVLSPTKTTVKRIESYPAYLSLGSYPNPFNPSTTIKYTIPNVETRHPAKAGQVASSLQQVTLKVYDILGREVATLINEEKQPGSYEVKFNGSELASGIYFCLLTTNNTTKAIKIVLQK